MARTKIFAGNWKMNFGPTEACEYFGAITTALGGRKPTEKARWVIFPPAYALGRDVQAAATKAHIELGAQNAHWEEKGAFTGELSPAALKTLGVTWCLVAHSERRQFFGETDETASKRFAAAAKLGLNVIYCVGEKLSEREARKTETILTRQMEAFIKVRKQLPKTNALWAIAYEPVWAIGTGKTATNEQAEEAHKHIRKELAVGLGLDESQTVPILYGGSVTPDNASGLFTQPNIDGVLVGGASLKPDGFSQILRLESQS